MGEYHMGEGDEGEAVGSWVWGKHMVSQEARQEARRLSLVLKVESERRHGLLCILTSVAWKRRCYL